MLKMIVGGLANRQQTKLNFSISLTQLNVLILIFDSYDCFASNLNMFLSFGSYAYFETIKTVSITIFKHNLTISK